MKTPNTRVTPSVKELIISKLFIIGIPSNLKGYEYIKTGLVMALEDPSILDQVTKTFYPGLAEMYGTTASRVERATRTAIEAMFSRMDPEYLRDKFGLAARIDNGKLTNSEFLAGLAEIIRLEIGVYG